MITFIALYLYALGCVISYLTDYDEPHAGSPLHLMETFLWPVVSPVYISVWAWHRFVKGD